MRISRSSIVTSAALFFAAVLAATPAATRADTIHLDSIGDTLLVSQPSDANNYGDYAVLQAGQYGSKATRSIFRFDVASMPSYTRINSITFSVAVKEDRTGDNDYVAKVYEIAQANSGWTEDGATWNDADDSTAWAGDSGLTDAGTDYIDTLLASHTFTTTVTDGSSIDFTFTGDTAALTAIFDRWTQQGNAGLLLIGDTGGLAIDTNNDVKYWPREHGDTNNPVPQLIVDYTVPEPGTGMLALLGLGGLMMLPRRRREVASYELRVASC